jgi:NTE family protein
VLVLQGGGALGAYQVGVYEALHEAGIEPDWVIGTSIGAINGAIIAGNPPAQRLHQLDAFWASLEQHSGAGLTDASLAIVMANLATVARGLPTFFSPNPTAWFGHLAPLGVEAAAYYSTAPLRETLSGMIDFDYVNGKHVRLTVGAVNVRSGEMRYFDSRDEALCLEHVMASGALPPAFPAVRIDGAPYWDGGLYSNTPIEAVLDDKPRKDSLIFSVQMWNPEGSEPGTLWEVAGRQKDIQYASRAKSHIARQKQIHHLRHIIRELAKHVPEKARGSATVKELSSWGCGSIMHVVRLNAPRLPGEDQLKDIDFTPAGIGARRAAGRDATRRMIATAPWKRTVDPIEGVVIHE